MLRLSTTPPLPSPSPQESRISFLRNLALLSGRHHPCRARPPPLGNPAPPAFPRLLLSGFVRLLLLLAAAVTVSVSVAPFDWTVAAWINALSCWLDRRRRAARGGLPPGRACGCGRRERAGGARQLFFPGASCCLTPKARFFSPPLDFVARPHRYAFDRSSSRASALPFAGETWPLSSSSLAGWFRRIWCGRIFKFSRGLPSFFAALQKLLRFSFSAFLIWRWGVRITVRT
jgi:hypothetical protein